MEGRSSKLTIRRQDMEWQVLVRIRARDGGQGQTQPGDHPAWPPGRDRSKLIQEARSESGSGWRRHRPERRHSCDTAAM